MTIRIDDTAMPATAGPLTGKGPESDAVYLGIREVMRAMARRGIAKDRKNQQQGYNFRGIDDVYNSLSAELVEAGLVIIPYVQERNVVERQSAKGGALFYVTVDVTYRIWSCVDGSSVDCRVMGEAMDSADKATNKAMSAAYKYMALQLFCIPTEGDNDADATTNTVQSMVKQLMTMAQSVNSPEAFADWREAVSRLSQAERRDVDLRNVFWELKRKYDTEDRRIEP